MAGILARRREAEDVRPVDSQDRFGQQEFNRLADDLAGRIAEGILGAAIEMDDRVSVVDRDDRVRGDGEDAGDLRL